MTTTQTIPINTYNTDQTNVDKFWSKVKVLQEEDCWEWQAALHQDGYGFFAMTTDYNTPIQYKVITAHRYSAHLDGKDISNMCVCHTCDNPSCVNPKHLFVGTIQDNVKDRQSKNRQARNKGKDNGRTKLTRDQAQYILDNAQIGTKKNKLSNIQSLADEFNVTTECIRAVQKRKTWKYLVKGESND